MVNLIENDRYRRVCFEPVDGPRLRFFHHTHDQASDTPSTGAARPAPDTGE